MYNKSQGFYDNSPEPSIINKNLKYVVEYDKMFINDNGFIHGTHIQYGDVVIDFLESADYESVMEKFKISKSDFKACMIKWAKEL